MTFRSWIQKAQRGDESLYSRFNGAMTFRSWIRGSKKYMGQIHFRFNGAMTFRSWIHTITDQGMHQISGASMGP